MGGGTVGQHVVLFALNANLLIVWQAWSTMKIPLGILSKFQRPPDPDYLHVI